MTVSVPGASYNDVDFQAEQEAIEFSRPSALWSADDNGNFNPDQR